MKTPARKLALLPMALVAIASAAACDSGKTSPSNKNCSETTAFSNTAFRGTSLKAKQLALTFDDGPGDRTTELSQYLKDQGIQAVFFVNGKMMGLNSDLVLQKLIDDGHLVGNHTETHASMTGLATGTPHPPDSTVISEIDSTDKKIAPYVKNNIWLFRPPFGDWDDLDTKAIAATPLNKYVGPIDWDMGDHMGPAQAADWDCWQPGSDNLVLTTTQCGDLYLKEIKDQGKGIVLMHDPYGDDKGNTVDMVKYLVPKLKELGFTFVRVDQVPDIAAALPQPAPLPGGDAGTSSGDPATTPPETTPPPPAESTPPAPTPDPCASASNGTGTSHPADTNHGESGNLAKR